MVKKLRLKGNMLDDIPHIVFNMDDDYIKDALMNGFAIQHIHADYRLEYSVSTKEFTLYVMDFGSIIGYYIKETDWEVFKRKMSVLKYCIYTDKILKLDYTQKVINFIEENYDNKNIPSGIRVEGDDC